MVLVPMMWIQLTLLILKEPTVCPIWHSQVRRHWRHDNNGIYFTQRDLLHPQWIAQGCVIMDHVESAYGHDTLEGKHANATGVVRE